MSNIREIVREPMDSRECSLLVREVREKLTQDIKDLEAFAKERDLHLSYDRRDTQLRERLNKQFLVYPKINPSGFASISERINKLLEISKENLKRDINYSFKFNKKMSEANQIKIVFFRDLLNIREYISRAYNIDIGYISEYHSELDDNIIKKYENGNMVVQFTEEQFNIINELAGN